MILNIIGGVEAVLQVYKDKLELENEFHNFMCCLFKVYKLN